jgi:hypothetical protein
MNPTIPLTVHPIFLRISLFLHSTLPGSSGSIGSVHSFFRQSPHRFLNPIDHLVNPVPGIIDPTLNHDITEEVIPAQIQDICSERRNTDRKPKNKAAYFSEGHSELSGKIDGHAADWYHNGTEAAHGMPAPGKLQTPYSKAERRNG